MADTMTPPAGLLPRFAITTPERVTFYRRPAELPTRAIAWLIDQALVMVLRIAFLATLLGIGEIGLGLALVLLLVLDFGYFTILEWRWAGQTPGKRAMGLRVVSATGARLDGGDLLLRNLVRPIDSLPFTMAVGGTVAWIDPYRRRLGDLLAGTLVVRDVQAELPKAVFDAGQRVNSFEDEPAVRRRILARANRDERDLLMDLAQRRDQLEPAVRAKLFAQAHAYFAERFALPDADHLSDEQAVLNLALVLRDPRRG
ncbi:MAG: RDD family protein [Planctomycetota bacterium]